MDIAIDASRCTVGRVTGTEYYARELIRYLILQNDTLPSPHQLALYFRDTPSPDLLPTSSHVDIRVIPFKRAWTHLRFAREIWRTQPTVTFVPAHTLPFVMRGQAVVTIHDLGYKLFPQAHPFRQRLYLDLTTRYSVQRANIVFADSRATQDDLTRYYDISPHKIRVIYPAIQAPVIHNVDIRAKYQLPERYFVFIGTLQPRKNIARLVQAFARFQAQTHSEVGLVLAGGKGWLFEEAWLTGAKNVHLIGYIDEGDKGTLLSNALALTFPSLYEGFGFPVLEAMCCGTPVIASNTSSLPELVGEAGILVDPLRVEDIAHAMQVMAEQPEQRQLWVQRGFEQVKTFSWANSAREVLWAFETLSEA